MPGEVWALFFGKLELDDRTHLFEISKCEDDRLRIFLELLVCDTDFKGDQISPRRLKPEEAFMKAMLPGVDQNPHLPVFM
ncbi:hypothetical protein ACEPPN_005914 [Leptodophora sp. 'Broadleaf-Isolate-01']